jgi:hypothetical protein
MARILTFARIRCTGVEQKGDQTLVSACRLQDTLTEAWTEVTVRLPDLDIADVKGVVLRGVREEEGDYSASLRRLVGVRVGPGMLKIIEGLLDETPCKGMLAYMIEECCHGVILSFTKDVLLASPRPTEPEAEKEFYRNMVKENIRLYNRCAAFAPGSSLVEGIEPPTSSAIRS